MGILSQEETEALLNPLRCGKCEGIINKGEFRSNQLKRPRHIDCVDLNDLEWARKFWVDEYNKNIKRSADATPGLMDMVY